MKGFVLPLLGLLCLLPPPAAHAGPGSVGLRDAFRAYVKLRQLEEKSRIAEGRADLEEGAKLELTHALARETAGARAEYRAFLGSGARDLSAWERGVLAKVGKPAETVDKAGLDFLDGAFRRDAIGWSPLAWESAGDWFGKPTEDAFLKLVFGMEEIPAGRARSAERASERILWLNDPLSRYHSRSEGDREKAERAQAKNQLETAGYLVEDLDVGSFSRLDDQAEELHLLLARRISDGAPFTLVSAGYASAVLLRTLDLNPGLLQNPSIRGWVNVNGKLFGERVPPSRAPASLSKADRPLHDVWHELLLLRDERLGPQTPLGAKFPVLNVLTLKGDHRPGPSLRDSLLPDGKTVYVPKGDAAGSLRNAIPLLSPRAPSGQRDL